MVRKAEVFPPVTMGHIRGHGCRDLLVYCGSGRQLNLRRTTDVLRKPDNSKSNRHKCEYRTAAGGRRPNLEHFGTIQGAGTGFGLWFCVGSTARSLGGRLLARRFPSVG